ncbi:histidine kinase dimerization/phosphoacceptor domain -containing protein, partial [Acinetobacter baumannii]
SPLINGASVSVQLEASLERETALRQKIEDLVRHQNAQVEEFDHRLLNGIQMIISLLSAQSRTASAETAAQLKIAINRIL